MTALSVPPLRPRPVHWREFLASTMPSARASAAARNVSYSATTAPRCRMVSAIGDRRWQPTVRPTRSRGPRIVPATRSAVIVAVSRLVNVAIRPMPPIIHRKARTRPRGLSTCLSSQPPVTITEPIHHIASQTPPG